MNRPRKETRREEGGPRAWGRMHAVLLVAKSEEVLRLEGGLVRTEG